MTHWSENTRLLEFPRLFGLIGYPLSHSFSKQYFADKFQREGITGSHYEPFPIETIDQLPQLIRTFPNLVGLNVTIPYKQQVIPFLDTLDAGAEAVGAVNTIKITGEQWSGANSDVYGFQQSLEDQLARSGLSLDRALILGTGGAAKAVLYVLNKMGIAFSTVSRSAQKADYTYADINADILEAHQLIVNTTPLGMAPKVDTAPELPYSYLGPKHLLYDLVYNPEETVFLRRGKEQGAVTLNGLPMLYLQAEKSWEIWNT